MLDVNPSIIETHNPENAKKSSDNFDLMRFNRKQPATKAFWTIKIAWPVYAWRAVVPELLIPQETDPIMLAILRLAKVGCVQATEVSKLLGLPATLIRRIQAECSEKDFIDAKDLKLTRNGEKVLKATDEPIFNTQDKKSGWIFRDVITGEVLPKFYDGSLNPAPNHVKTQISRLGTNSDNRRIYSDKPTPRKISTALRLYNRILNYSSSNTDPVNYTNYNYNPEETDNFVPETNQNDWQDFDDNNQTLSNSSQADVPFHVRLLSERPDFIYVETYFCVPRDNPDEWLIASPFDDPGGGWFSRRLQWGIDHDSALKQQFTEWQQKAKNELTLDSTGEITTALEWVTLLDDLQECKLLQPVLATAQQAYRAVERFQQQPDNFDLVPIRYQKLLEAILEVLIENIPDLLKLVNQVERQHVGWCELEKELNIADVPSGIKYKFKDLARIARNRTALRDRTVLLVAYAYLDENAPFRKALQANPYLLNQIDMIADYRNQNAHYNSNQIQDNTTIAENLSQALHNAIKTIAQQLY